MECASRFVSWCSVTEVNYENRSIHITSRLDPGLGRRYVGIVSDPPAAQVKRRRRPKQDEVDEDAGSIGLTGHYTFTELSKPLPPSPRIEGFVKQKKAPRRRAPKK